MREDRGIHALEDLAATQWGLFTTAQARTFGVRGSQCQRLVESGRATKMRRGVYAFGDAWASEQADVRSAWLTAYPTLSASERLANRPYDAVVTGRTAAAARGLGNFYTAPYVIAVRERRQTVQDDLQFPLRPIDDRDVYIVDGLPVAKPERIVYDLIRSSEDPAHVGDVMREAALNGYVFDEERLAELLAPLAARHGYPKLDGATFARSLLAEHVDGPLTQLTSRTIKGILDAYSKQPSYQRAMATAQAFASTIGKAGDQLRPQMSAMAIAEALSKVSGAVENVVLPTPVVLESLNSIVQSINALYGFRRDSEGALDPTDTTETGADDSIDDRTNLLQPYAPER